MIGRVAAFGAAVAVSYLLASVFATQAVLASIAGMGLPVGIGTRVAATWHDLRGMAGSFLPLVGAALLVALLVSSLIARRWPARRTLLHVAAGAVGLGALHGIMHLAFGITPVAAARTLAGLGLQCLAGACGGFVFSRDLRDLRAGQSRTR